MRYIQIKLHASRRLHHHVVLAGLPLRLDDPADVSDIMEKKHSYDWDFIDESLMQHPDREPVMTAWFDDTEENRQTVQDIKIALMKLKAEEQYQTFGPDADFSPYKAPSIVALDACTAFCRQANVIVLEG